ncbi:acyltransferase [Paraburkholderia sp. BL10I2N1]|uniref:acyltransferase family protein n=1 Tax=Paraburkholderia sp. BL10I2N1 TaxID=1938796 RepID=UPI00105D0BAE|nr:acyltransferase [Paraburkholderia sp. BL10I2N1]TDN58896.1 peptidoglycan/LPS O-acetylase OafA/YrhL [Paraburkholderia sp. BL10I2N1]
MVNERKPAIPALTGIRFFAALSVALFHLSRPIATSLHLPVGYFFDNGGAPELFFILSGFTLTYARPEGANLSRATTRKFYFSRFSKIYPTYLVGWLLFAPLIYSNLVSLHGTGMATYARLAVYGVASLLLVQAWAPVTANAWNLPGWSLSAQAFFYVLFPFLFAALKRFPAKTLVSVIAVAWGVSVAPTAVLSIMPQPYPNLQWAHDIVDFTPAWRIAEFIAGICLGRLFLAHSSTVSFGFDVAAAVLFVFSMAAMVSVGHLMSKLLQFPFFLLLVYCLACASGPFSQLLGTRLMTLLGEASFAFYILHMPIARFAVRAFPGLLDTPAGFVLFLLALTGLSIVCLMCVEKPVFAYLRSAYKASSPAQLNRPGNSGDSLA